MRKPTVVVHALVSLLFAGCATGHASNRGTTHAARPLSRSSSPSHIHSSGSHAHGGSHGGDAFAGACLEVLCGMSTCLLDGAAASAEYAQDEQGNTVLSTLGDDPPPLPPPTASLAGDDPALHGSAAPPELTDAIVVAQLWLRQRELEPFVARFVPRAERDAAAAQGRNLVQELSVPRIDALLAQLAQCEQHGAQVSEDHATCLGAEPRLPWHLETYGWVMDGIVAVQPAPVPTQGDPAPAASTPSSDPASTNAAAPAPQLRRRLVSPGA